MNAMFASRENFSGSHSRSSSPTSPVVLDRKAIATGAADRRARAEEIETEMDEACEQAALGTHLVLSSPDRRAWDSKTWGRYVAEAVRQARIHASALEGLRQEAAQLDRLLRAS